MNKKYILLCGAALVASGGFAQKLQAGYVIEPESMNLPTYIQQWNGGNGTITVNNSTWEDEEFYTSRVKPRQRFVNRHAQVRQEITDQNDKRYVNWVPMGYAGYNALPNGEYDQEVFSMWSYVDHYGDWTTPYGWATGAMADICHKNGVAVSGVASVPFGGDDGWFSSFRGMTGLSSDAVGKFLYYHGVDGLGYNSEWSGYSPSGLITMHDALKAYMKDRNPLWEVIWYGGTTDAGGCSFDIGINSSKNLFRSASIFLNYNWNRQTYYEQSVQTANSMGKSPFYIYAGMNQQGGEPKNGENYSLIKDWQYSIGIWGAHSLNMFWASRNAGGASVEAMQRYYLNTCEQWYTNGPRNPAVRLPIKTVRDHRPRADWAGISSMMSARSPLAWDITNEPFITYFNLGNGKFFNWMGQRISNSEWYSLAVQDYLPTWRWWLTPEFMQGEVAEGGWNLAADFTWDDAYFGGSCLQVTGTTADEYLHLFKTKFDVDYGQTLTVRYKILEGEADVNLVLSSFDNPTEINDVLEVLTVAQSDKQIDASLREWQTATFALGEDVIVEDLQDNGGLGVIALEFKNAKNLKLLLGEISIKSDEAAATPEAPTVTKSKVLAYTQKGVDGKLWWQMANKKQVGEPVYNSDVNTSIFKVYSQEEGAEPTFVGVTTSWAAVAFQAPVSDSDKKIRFGVSAVSTDYATESEIAWGQYLERPAYAENSEVVLSKNPIKPNEAFKLGYVDHKHAASTWELTDETGKVVFTGSGVEVELPNGLPEVGGYDLTIDKGTAAERKLGYYVQISGEEVGALPEIYTISRGTEDVTDGGAAVKIELTDTPTLSYTGRASDGQASRALALNSGYIGSKVSDLNLQAQQSFSIAGWFKFDAMPAQEWNFMNVSNKTGSWPQNTWGWSWNYGTPEGDVFCIFRGNASDGGSPGELHYSFPNLKLQPNVWTHIAYVCEYASEGFRLQLYVNGIKQESRVFQYAVGNGGTCRTLPNGTVLSYTSVNGKNIGVTDGDTYIEGQTYPVQADDYVYFGGAKHEGAAIDGLVDDFQIWGKAMTAEEVRESMKGYVGGTLNSGIKALWDFESEANEDHSFNSVGSLTTPAKGFNYEVIGNPDGGKTYYNFRAPVFLPGCSFLKGTGFPIETKPVWSDTNRKTTFEKVGSRAATEGEAGSAKVSFVTEGDHTVQLTLKNPYGESTMTYPVFTVGNGDSAIEGVEADQADVDAYTVDDILFIEFAADGNYDVQVYNTAGMLCGAETLAAVAGQNAQITLGQKGVYLVRVARDGQVLRTIKVISK